MYGICDYGGKEISCNGLQNLSSVKYSLVIKLFLTALLLIATFVDDLPYGYFQYLRFAAFLGFGWLAYHEITEKRPFTGVLALALAILFNPILKIRLKRSDWETMDGLTAFYLALWLIVGGIVYLIKKRKSKNRAQRDQD